MLQLVEPLQAREVGEHPVKEDEIDALALEDFLRLAYRACAQRLIARGLAGKADELTNGGFVFNDENGVGHDEYVLNMDGSVAVQ